MAENVNLGINYTVGVYTIITTANLGTIGHHGGEETRPLNMALHYIIKY